MPEYHAVTFQRHGQICLRAPIDYRFAAGDAVVSLGMNELTPALVSCALAFVNSDEGLVIAAIQGVVPGQNLLVSAAGQWEGGYIPRAYRVHPFRMALSDNGDRLLCVDEADSRLCGPDDVTGVALFDTLGNPTEVLSKISHEISVIEAERARMSQVCALLARHELLEPWPLKLELAGRPHEINGLYRINEATLNKVDAAVLEELRDQTALLVAYAQLFSMQNIHTLATHLERRAEETRSASLLAAGGVFSKNELISFGNL
jgi:hypothetical protein